MVNQAEIGFKVSAKFKTGLCSLFGAYLSKAGVLTQQFAKSCSGSPINLFAVSTQKFKVGSKEFPKGTKCASPFTIVPGADKLYPETGLFTDGNGCKFELE